MIFKNIDNFPDLTTLQKEQLDEWLSTQDQGVQLFAMFKYKYGEYKIMKLYHDLENASDEDSKNIIKGKIKMLRELFVEIENLKKEIKDENASEEN